MGGREGMDGWMNCKIMLKNKQYRTKGNVYTLLKSLTVRCDERGNNSQEGTGILDSLF